MSSAHMAQVFAGSASSDEIDVNPRRKGVQKVNLFLPEYVHCRLESRWILIRIFSYTIRHHLVEGVYFTSRQGFALHPALASVQTPGREYFILRDNGMEVGCEEDGIWPAWMKLLSCDNRGLVL